MLKSLLGLSLLLSAVQLAANETRTPLAMSLEAVYGLALGNAPSLAIAEYRVESAEAQSAEAAGGLLPQLSIFGEWSENTLSYDGPLSAIYGEQTYPGERYGFQARQPLFNMARFRELQRREVLFNRSESHLAQAGIELLELVTEAFLGVLISENTVKQFQAESDALEKQLEEAQALYARSLISLTQVLETQTRSETVKADLIEAQGQSAIARERLIELTGLREFDLMPMSMTVALPVATMTVEEAVTLALQHSPIVSAAREDVEAAEYAVKREKGTLWPEVSLVVSQQYSDVGFDNLTSPPRTTESISIALNYPLLQGGARAARIRGAWAEYYALKEELEGVQRAVETKTRSAWVGLSAANKRVQAAQQALETSKVNVLATQKSVKAGTARVSDVLFALAQRTRAQRDRLFADQQRVMAWLQLQLITGTEPGSVAPLLSDALLSSAAVSAAALVQ